MDYKIPDIRKLGDKNVADAKYSVMKQARALNIYQLNLINKVMTFFSMWFGNKILLI